MHKQGQGYGEWMCMEKRNEENEENKPLVLTPVAKTIKVKARCVENEVVQEQTEDDDITDNYPDHRCKDDDDDLIDIIDRLNNENTRRKDDD